ncbi:integrase core domain-containing protein [Achromobacter piechaudii]|uniref:integrase core domain-containing protein n=1 Tax=Achromobacter piechaudii TaxID=72556 RepID=UPI0015825054
MHSISLQAKGLIEKWRVEYNTERPHSALGYLAPAQFAQAHQKEALFNPALYVGAVIIWEQVNRSIIWSDVCRSVSTSPPKSTRLPRPAKLESPNQTSRSQKAAVAAYRRVIKHVDLRS